MKIPTEYFCEKHNHYFCMYTRCIRKKNETFTIEQKLVKVQKKNILITFFDVVASYLYALAMALHLLQEGRSIVITDQSPGDLVLLLLEGLRSHGLACHSLQVESVFAVQLPASTRCCKVLTSLFECPLTSDLPKFQTFSNV